MFNKLEAPYLRRFAFQSGTIGIHRCLGARSLAAYEAAGVEGGLQNKTFIFQDP